MIPVAATLKTDPSTVLTEQPNWPIVILIGLLQTGGTMGLLYGMSARQTRLRPDLSN